MIWNNKEEHVSVFVCVYLCTVFAPHRYVYRL